jgi:hypothetical protein
MEKSKKKQKKTQSLTTSWTCNRILIVDSSDSARAITPTVQEKRNQLLTLCVATGERNGNERIF